MLRARSALDPWPGHGWLKMKTVLPLFVMIDACGWEIVREDPFLASITPLRKRLESVFGYSSACIPSILSGRWPAEHYNWSYFVFDPKRSPFKDLRALRFLPKALTGRRIVRRMLTRLCRKHLGFEGYFDLYNIPFEFIHLFDFTEKRSPLRPGGLNRGPNVFDFLEQKRIPYFVSRPERSERENLDALKERIESEELDFAFCYWPGLDGLLHRVGNQSPEVPARLRAYEEWVAELAECAGKHYDEVHLYVFSDHGMANCDELLDLKSKIDQLPCRMARDYVVAYDSTMARFWFFNEKARAEIVGCLETVPEGRILPDEELAELKAFFPDRYFGELFFLVREGVLIVPSHMGERPLRAMHGYHPSEKHSYAVMMTNQPQLPEPLTAIPHIYDLMITEAQQAQAANAAAGAVQTTS
jgi:predicted AlkP superfamily pyrophosphatase or phosphodiesterase